MYSVFSQVKWTTLVIELSEDLTGDGESKMEAKGMWERCGTLKVTKRLLSFGITGRQPTTDVQAFMI